jgi:hypothetical protein
MIKSNLHVHFFLDVSYVVICYTIWFLMKNINIDELMQELIAKNLIKINVMC